MTMLTQAEIYAAYREKVLSYLTGKRVSREDAEDVCEDIFEQVFRSLPRYDAKKASLSTWIYQITRFTLIDYLRTNHPGEPLGEDLPSGETLEGKLIRKETLETLASALKALDPELRGIVLLRYYKGLTLAEISRVTGVSYGMVKVKHKKALSILRTQLE